MCWETWHERNSFAVQNRGHASEAIHHATARCDDAAIVYGQLSACSAGPGSAIMNQIFDSIAQTLGYGGTASDDVSIIVGPYQISGWESVKIMVGVEIMPWTAEFTATEQSPQSGLETPINEGDACQIKIGKDTIITGWVITVSREVDADNHILSVSVASKSIDLVECAAEFFTFSMNSTNALAIAKKVCAPFSIEVLPAQSYVERTPIQQFAVIITESPYEIIEKICRTAGCLFYDRPDGNITLSGVVDDFAASGFVQGQNVESFRVTRTMHDRFSSVRALLSTTAILYNPPPDEVEEIIQEMDAITGKGCIAFDPLVTRHRPLLINVEIGDPNYEITQRRVQWEVNRRAARGLSIQLTCDSWRDAAGALWQPNTRAIVDLPAGKPRYNLDYVISEICFRRDESGTHADVTLMPAAGLSVEPMVPPAQQQEALVAIGRPPSPDGQ
ncbi:phage baseplate assembly protein [Gluconacetobacter tumulicola]|uniref:Phage tail protein n=1 Tax=Gluconacetobacter tumulicola TaxID=1017177 RepID=A0A7W4JF32_9PROT|nr:phage tail protein [Gluconacetobacter tumulicola]MBB2180106.1 phage tail protein [Gluconacetobacter tumulicola]